MEFINLKTQYAALEDRINERIGKVLAHGQYILGPEVGELEEKLATYTGARHCITTASGTEALLIALMALGIGRDDEVVTTPFTFVATAEVIALLGATPVFVDVEPDTGNLDAGQIEAAIGPRTRAIMPVSLYGQPADMVTINDIARRHDLAVIEDAAQSFGATCRGLRSCNLSTLACTSFFPSKPLGCYGDGGALFTNDDNLAQIAREVRIHGQERRYLHTRIGVGGRMDTLQAAIVLAKLERFDWEVTRRLELGNRYNTLMDAAGIARIQQRPDRTSIFAQYTILTEDRTSWQSALRVAGIPTAVHYPTPLHRQPAYRERVRLAAPCPMSEQMAERVLSLPMSADLSEAEQDAVLQVLKEQVLKI